jgi:hypothetical protein
MPLYNNHSLFIITHMEHMIEGKLHGYVMFTGMLAIIFFEVQVNGEQSYTKSAECLFKVDHN